MISADYCRLMARYNHWQNTSLVAAADTLTDSERWMDRGAFFNSIAATLNHLYWADALMLERLKGNERPQDSITHSLTNPSEWSEFKAMRAERDAEVTHWARCLIPRFDGAILSMEWKEALWDKFVTGAPRTLDRQGICKMPERGRTPSEQQYSDRKLRSRS